jgi:hypothetical protein
MRRRPMVRIRRFTTASCAGARVVFERIFVSLAAKPCAIAPCFPSTKNRKQRLDYDKVLYRQRHKIEICSPS